MKRVHRNPLLLCVPLLVAALLSPSQRSFEAGGQVNLSAELVLIDAEVTDKKSGQVVSGLNQQDFTLYEDGVKQEIRHFSQDQLGLSVVLLMDVSSSVNPILDQLREQAQRALQPLNPDDEVALMVFAGSTELLQGLTSKKQLITGQIEMAETASVARGTLINEAVYQAAAYVRKASTPNHRRVIIIVTDNLSDSQRGHTEEEALHELLESRATLCGVIFDWTQRLGVDERIRERVVRYLSKLRMVDVRTFAERTGGIVVAAEKEDIEAKLTQVIARLRSRYTLGYVPLNLKRDGGFREIRLKISREVEKREGAVTIITRKGYYAPRSDGTHEAAMEGPSAKPKK
jgi:VWFA-related protein